MSHIHIEKINRFYNNFDTDTAIGKNNSGVWIHAPHPTWVRESMYHVVATRHLDLALKFYNEGIEIEQKSTAGAKTRENPSFSHEYDYREKPVPKERWVCVHKLKDEALPVIKNSEGAAMQFIARHTTTPTNWNAYRIEDRDA